MSHPDIFSVTRRFDLATVLVAMSGYALLFTGMLLLDFTAPSLALVGALFAVVALGQGVAMRWNKPRAASVIAGTAYWFAVFLFTAPAVGADEPCFVVAMFIGLLTLGPISGYCAGALVGGVFLVSYYLRQSAVFSRRHAEHAERPNESPWDDSSNESTP